MRGVKQNVAITVKVVNSGNCYYKKMYVCRRQFVVIFLISGGYKMATFSLLVFVAIKDITG
jgi:hypothetical protein